MQLSDFHQPAQDLKGPLGYSMVFHVVLFGALISSTIFSHHGEVWGGAGGQGTINVNLVGSVPAIPLPKPDVVTTNRVVDNTKGLYQTEPQPKPLEVQPQPKVPPPDDTNAIYLPKFDRERDKKPSYIQKPSRVLENPAPPPKNAIPYGKGGTPQIPTSTFMMNQATRGGMGVQGTTGGSFGFQFPWYVEAVQRRVSSNWLESTVDPTIPWAPRCIVSFQILRDGTVANVQIMQSSGNQSVDSSAIRAVQSSNPLDRLPPGYSGSYVNVEFWFDFRRQ
ncbi:MAG TPA: energy transducer TonB [Candidatus Acidoferrales bacterium]|nr:energy transducer TonB [Candidatus Acidoferrales bacterium]